jgi:hypothetical protein
MENKIKKLLLDQTERINQMRLDPDYSRGLPQRVVDAHKASMATLEGKINLLHDATHAVERSAIKFGHEDLLKKIWKVSNILKKEIRDGEIS